MIMGDSVSEAYFAMLRDTVETGSNLMQVTEVRTPVLGGRTNIDDDFYLRFKEFIFPDGTDGASWIEGRINAVFSEKGEYFERIHEGGYAYSLLALGSMKKGNYPLWNSNRLIINLFKSEDLHEARNPTPPCLISLGFYPEKDRLSLIGTFRAQYTDAKAFGNLISLAMILSSVCEETGYKPKSLFNVAQKAILKYPPKVGKELLIELMKGISYDGK